MFRLRLKFFIITIAITYLSIYGKTFYADSKTLTGHGDSIVCNVPEWGNDSVIIDFVAIEASVALPHKAFQGQKSGQWQISWAEGSAALVFDFSSHDFATDREGATVVINGVSHRIENAIDCHGGVNTLCIEWRSGMAEVFAGGRRLVHVASVDLPWPVDGFSVSSTVEANVESAAMEIESRPTPYSSSNLSEIKGTGLPIEGIWQYLDRENDPSLTVVGGKYRIAISNNGNGGFDLIYMEGASTNAPEWKSGMLKGRLHDLGFTDHYRLEWFDAMHRTMGDECYVKIESTDVITFCFPLQGASLRFQRLHSTM